jgi:hypothetical protein
MRRLLPCLLLRVAFAKDAVAVLLTTKPSGKADGWSPRSVKATAEACSAGPSLCAVLVLRATVRAYGNIPTADFVALVDEPCPHQLRVSLEANDIVAHEMRFDDKKRTKLFGDYLLMRKFYIFSLVEYDKVLLLDTDTIVVGSLKHLFATKVSCGAALSASNAADTDRCWPETDEVCQAEPVVLAQQTVGTPVLTAFFLAYPSLQTWDALADELYRVCGEGAICNKRRIYALGWLANATTKPPSGARFGSHAYNVTTYKPHAWAMRRAQTGRRRFRIGASPWEGMGAGFTDQGFAEHYFALQKKNLYSVSHRTCKLKYVHFNMPPKPWFCPGKHCQKHAAFKESDEVDLRWGGHKCAQDWWWQYVVHRPAFVGPPQSCAAKCLYALDQKQRGRSVFTDAAMTNFTPRCKDWDARWPPLDISLRPPDAHRPSLFAPFPG